MSYKKFLIYGVVAASSLYGTAQAQQLRVPPNVMPGAMPGGMMMGSAPQVQDNSDRNRPQSPNIPFAVNNAQSSNVSSDVPPSSEAMNMNSGMISNAINKTQMQANSRLSQLTGAKITPPTQSDENLPAPDLSKDAGELSQMQDIQKHVRLLNLQQQEADAAIKLWTTLFDIKKENNPDGDDKDATTTGNTTPTLAESNHSGVSRNGSRTTIVSNSGVSKNEVDDLKKQIMDLKTQMQAIRDSGDSGDDDISDMSPQEKSMNPEKAKNYVPPEAKVVMVTGSGQKKVATILIPYIGEQDVTLGSKLPGGRTVNAINETSGVTVQEKDGSHTILSFGAVVPGDAKPDDSAAATSIDFKSKD